MDWQSGMDIGIVWYVSAEFNIVWHSMAHFGIVYHSFTLPIPNKLLRFHKKTMNIFSQDLRLCLTMPHYDAL